MIAILAHLLLSAALLLLVAHVVSGIEVRSWGPAIVGALVGSLLLTVLNLLIVSMLGSGR